MPPVETYKVNASRVLGLGDVQAKLRELSKRVGVNVVRRGLLAGGGVIRDEARRLAPERTGALKKSIISRTTRKARKPNEVLTQVVISNKVFTSSLKPATAPGGKPRFKLKSAKRKKGDSITGKIYPRNYAHLVEFGTAPHALGKGSKRNPKKGVPGQHGRHHPGARAKPFLRPAFFSKYEAALEAVKVKLRAELALELAKLAQKRRKAG